MSLRHFLSLDTADSAWLRRIIHHAIALKRRRLAGERRDTMQGKILAMVFEKSSTRTRVSFEAGMAQLGGSALFLSKHDTQLSRGEPIEDTARVLSSMVDLIMVRTFEHDKLLRLAQHASVPVINGLTDFCHPCQLLADLQTFTEIHGDIAGNTVAWIGDGNNMCNTYMHAACLLGFHLNIAAPDGYRPNPQVQQHAAGHFTLFDDPREAVRNCRLIATDVWTSMGQEAENAARRKAFAHFQVNGTLLDLTPSDAVFMHCLPTHRGEEVSSDVLAHPKSVVWQQAENRLHAQKALMEILLDVADQ